MKTSPTARPRHRSWLSSVVLGAAALLSTGLFGGFLFFLAADSAEYAVPAAAVGAITAAVGLSWQQSRARRRRRMAVLDAYAEREIARGKWSSTPRRGAA